MYCANCQRELPDEYTFCPHCGRTIAGTKGTKQAPSKPEASKKKKKHPVRTFLLLVLAAALLWNNLRHPEAVPEPTEAVQAAFAETAPSWESQPLDEYFLSFRDKGACGRLTGTVGIYFLFVDDDESGWTQEQMDVFLADARSRLDALEAEARRWQVSLEFSTGYCHTKVAGCIDGQNKVDFREAILESSGLDLQNPHEQILQYLMTENYLTVHQGMPVFVFNKSGRDVASEESAFLFRDAHALLHEMSHVFGTKDYYFLDDVKEQAERLLGEGIVLGGEDETIMDPLAAYQVGWTDTLSPEAEEFLRYISRYTRGEWEKAHEANTFTGYGTKVTDEYTYEGDLLYGLFHGKGTIRYTDGNSYSGDFDNGLRHGFGIFTWADGTSYEGEFHEGKRHGQGTIRWADGNSYTGDFVSDYREGSGIFTWADGSWYEGEFHEEERHGAGVLHFADGSWYEGEFYQGQMQGQGTYTWANGTRYEGEFYQGKCHGKGRCIYHNGTVEAGRWEMGTYIGK